MTFLAIACAFPILFGLLSKASFDRSFTILALLFALAFYCMPLMMVISEGSLVYVGRVFRFSSDDIVACTFAMFIFSAGFAAQSIILRWRARTRNNWETGTTVVHGGRAKLMETAFGVVMALLVVLLYRANFRQTIFAVRTSQEHINYGLASALILMYFVGAFYVILSLNRRSLALFVFWFVTTMALILIYGGRVQTMMVLALPAVFFARRLNVALILMCVAILLFLPLIIGGKELISAIAEQGDLVGTVIKLYQEPLSSDSVARNFAHPLISYLTAPSLVQENGYRWFWDLPQGFLFYFKLIGLDFGQSFTYFNTEAILGIRDSIVPPGYLAFGYAQANLFGVFVMGMFFRFTGSFSRYIKEHCLRDSAVSNFFFAFMAANTFYIGEMRALVLTFFAPCLCIYALSKFGERKQRRHPSTGIRATSHAAAWASANGRRSVRSPTASSNA